MSSRGAVAIVAIALTGLLVHVVQLPPEPGDPGRTLVSAGTHGVHLSDLPALALWVAGMLACAVLWRRTARRSEG